MPFHPTKVLIMGFVILSEILLVHCDEITSTDDRHTDWFRQEFQFVEKLAQNSVISLCPSFANRTGFGRHSKAVTLLQYVTSLTHCYFFTKHVQFDSFYLGAIEQKQKGATFNVSMTIFKRDLQFDGIS